MHKNAFALPVSFTGSYTRDAPKFASVKLSNFTEKKKAWRRQGCEFQGLFKT